MLYSRSLLVIDFAYSAVYMSIPICQFIPSVNSSCFGSSSKWIPAHPAPAGSHYTRVSRPPAGGEAVPPIRQGGSRGPGGGRQACESSLAYNL